MSNINKLTIIGRVGKDPEMRTTKEGKPVCNFSVAVDNGRGDQKKTEWFEVTCWNRLAETMGEYLVKGTLVYVEGAVNLQTYEKRDGTQGAKLAVTAFSIQMLSGKGQASDHQQEQQARSATPIARTPDKQAAPDPEPLDSDELPF